VQNTGSSPAYDLKLSGKKSENVVAVAASLCYSRSDGEPLKIEGASVWEGISVINVAAGVISAGEIAHLTFDVSLAPYIKENGIWTVDISIDQYASFVNGTNHLSEENGGKLVTTLEIYGTPFTVQKKVTSDNAFSNKREVVRGEVVEYEFTVTVPEGVTDLQLDTSYDLTDIEFAWGSSLTHGSIATTNSSYSQVTLVTITNSPDNKHDANDEFVIKCFLRVGSNAQGLISPTITFKNQFHERSNQEFKDYFSVRKSNPHVTAPLVIADVLYLHEFSFDIVFKATSPGYAPFIDLVWQDDFQMLENTVTVVSESCSKSQDVSVTITADNFLLAVAIGDKYKVIETDTHWDWKKSISLTGNGDHIAVKAQNAHHNGNDSPAGIVASIKVDGERVEGTSKNWLCTHEQPYPDAQGRQWWDRDYEDMKGWHNATEYGKHGVGPWGIIRGIDNDIWIWDSDAGHKHSSTVWCRAKLPCKQTKKPVDSKNTIRIRNQTIPAGTCINHSTEAWDLAQVCERQGRDRIFLTYVKGYSILSPDQCVETFTFNLVTKSSANPLKEYKFYYRGGFASGDIYNKADSKIVLSTTADDYSKWSVITIIPQVVIPKIKQSLRYLNLGTSWNTHTVAGLWVAKTLTVKHVSFRSRYQNKWLSLITRLFQ
jgi:hypothetical protein